MNRIANHHRHDWSVPRSLAHWLLLVASAALSGCMAPHYMDLETSSYAMTADKRTIISVPADRDAFTNSNKAGRIICPEPSPDVAKAVSRAIEAMIAAERTTAAGDKQSAKGQFSSTSVESLVQLGQRTVTIQAIRDEYADLCRSYANGAVNSTTYTIRLARLDRKMMSMHTSEMIAGNFGGTLAAISAGAAGQASPAKVIEAGEQLEKKLAAWKTECATGDTQCKLDKQTVKDLAAAQDAELKTLVSYVRGVGVGLSSTAAPAKVRDPDATRASADALVAVQAAFLAKDDLSILVDACVTALDYVKPVAGTNDERALQATVAAIQARMSAVEQNRTGAIASMGQAAIALTKANEELLAADRAFRATQQRLRPKPASRKDSPNPGKIKAAELELESQLDVEKADIDSKRAEVTNRKGTFEDLERVVANYNDTLARLDGELIASKGQLSPFGRWCAGHLGPLLDDARKTANEAARTHDKVVEFCLDRWSTSRPAGSAASPEVTALCNRVALTADIPPARGNR